jgi:hypothetical protein
MAKTKATHKTLDACRKLGWMPGIVERVGFGFRDGKMIPGGTKHDLFGFADIAVITDGECGVLFIQATAGGNGAARVRKIIDTCGDEALRVLATSNRIEVWDWRKYKRPTKAGGTKVRWDAKRWWIRVIGGKLCAVDLLSYLELKLAMEGGESR